MTEGFSYPDTPTVDHTDDYHGTEIADPYRWLEQPADTPEVRAWIEAQNALTRSHLGALPARRVFRQRLTALWDYPKAGVPFRKGGRLFQFRNSGLQNQDVLYVSEPAATEPDEATRVLLDPNLLSDDGTVALTGLSVSPDGARVAYAVSEGGSDWKIWRVRDVASGEDLPDRVPWSKFSGADWLPDGSGFFYTGYPEPREGSALTDANRAPRLKLHLLGDASADDAVILHRPDHPEWMLFPAVSADGSYLVVYLVRGTDPATQVWVRSLAGTAAGADLERDFTPLQGDFVAQTWVIGNDDATFYLRTDLDAERQRIVATDLSDPGRWREVVPEADHPLAGVALQGDTLLVASMVDATHRLHRWRLRHGAPAEPQGEIALPALGSVAELHAEREDDEVFFGFTSFLFPSTPFRYRQGDEGAESLGAPAVAFEADDYVTRQLFATSKDGTRVPLFVVHRTGLRPTGDHPTLLYGYGGFNNSLTPSFSVARLAWLEQGGVLAIANLRGGGEYGRAWHDGGRLANKQNVFDDFVACAETLMIEGITNRDRLAIQGGSNGGLLVGAALTQRPDLFGAAHAAVGVMDMLRFHHFTIGWAWSSDYGSADDPEQFATLLAYSPLHNLETGASYPPTLLTTGDHDDRVVPAHSFKFAAAMQAAQGGSAPVLIRIQTRAGHGMGKPTALLIEEFADVWAFLADALGMTVSVPRSERSPRVSALAPLRERILAEGRNLGGGILKVDGFLNHQLDPELTLAMGRAFRERFEAAGVSGVHKVVTAEVSGIAPALATAAAYAVPVVYARKQRPITMPATVFETQAPSHTKGGVTKLIVSPEYLRRGERVLLIDDFLASGHTVAALAELVRVAGGELLGIGCVIEKAFERGRERLASLEVPIETLAVVTHMDDGGDESSAGGGGIVVAP